MKTVLLSLVGLCAAAWAQFVGSHRSQPIWAADPMPLGQRSKLYDRREPFAEFTFQHGEGVNPPER